MKGKQKAPTNKLEIRMLGCPTELFQKAQQWKEKSLEGKPRRFAHRKQNNPSSVEEKTVDGLTSWGGSLGVRINEMIDDVLLDW